MIDKDLIIRKQNDALIKLSILMMIADRDLHDQEYKKVIEIIEKHSMYKISEDEISALVSDVSFQREKIGIKGFSNELCSTLKSKEKQKLAIEYLEDIMNRDNFIHEQEVKFLSYVKEIWSL